MSEETITQPVDGISSHREPVDEIKKQIAENNVALLKRQVAASRQYMRVRSWFERVSDIALIALSDAQLLAARVERAARVVTYNAAVTVAGLTAPKRGRFGDWVISFPKTEIQPGEIATIQTQPQTMFKGESIAALGDVDGLAIYGLFVGQRSQMPTFQEPVPLGLFRAEYQRRHEFPDWCEPALYITWQIKNTSDAPKTVSISVSGKARLS